MLSSKLLSFFFSFFSFFFHVFNCVLDGNVFNKGSLEVATGLHLSNNFHVSSTSKRLLKEMPNSTLCLTPLSSSQGLQTLGLPEHAHFFSTQPAINGAKQGTQISMRIGKERLKW